MVFGARVIVLAHLTLDLLVSDLGLSNNVDLPYLVINSLLGIFKITECAFKKSKPIRNSVSNVSETMNECCSVPPARSTVNEIFPFMGMV